MILEAATMSWDRSPDLRTQKRGPTVGAETSKGRGPVAGRICRGSRKGAISLCANESWELESGPTTEMTLQEQQTDRTLALSHCQSPSSAQLLAEP